MARFNFFSMMLLPRCSSAQLTRHWTPINGIQAQEEARKLIWCATTQLRFSSEYPSRFFRKRSLQPPEISAGYLR